ncbi:MAG TPA: helicase HerA-like domain-containing protein, partial [Streptosporangiaceae bacterium]|nr:helicase HerA-like domain-containing protein [Streptosporangiaceae bacterium]
MLAWDALSGLDAYRITEIPRRPEPGPAPAPSESDDPGRTQRLAALVAAYHAGAETKDNGSGALAIGWVRYDTDGPVQLLAAGPGLVGSDEGREVFLALPGGARARPLGRGSLTGLMARLPAWRAIGGISDGLLAGDERHPDGRRAPSLEECLLAAWPGPFGWLLVAEPLSAAEIGQLAEELAQREQYATGDSDRFPGRATAARRLSLRHAEMRTGVSAGMWRIWLLAGGTDAEAASRVAGLVCASADLSGLPYAITPYQNFGGDRGGGLSPRGVRGDGSPPERVSQQSAACGLREALENAGAAGPPPVGGDAVAGHPFCASSELVAAMSRPPERELPGIRLALRPDFDVTQEPMPGRAAITVGEILDRNRRPAGPLTLPLDSLNRHVFVSGATGSGKSQTVRALLEAATAAGIPWLVVEPAKAEYRLMAARLAGPGGPGAGGAAMARVVRIRPGEADAIAAGLNPLEPAADGEGRRFPLQTHADLVKALFIASFRSDEPFPQVLSAALTRVYEDAGWDLALGETVAADANPGYPSLTDLQRAAIRVVREIGYSQRITDDVLGFIKVRLSSLRLGTTGRFLEGGHQLDFGALLAGHAVLEIEDVGDDSDKAFLMGTVLIRLAEHLRMASRAGLTATPGLRHLTVIEEAHRLLR